MITIVNLNDAYGDPVATTAETLDGAVEQLQSIIRACGPDFADVTLTPDDYEIVTNTERG